MTLNIFFKIIYIYIYIIIYIIVAIDFPGGKRKVESENEYKSSAKNSDVFGSLDSDHKKLLARVSPAPFPHPPSSYALIIDTNIPGGGGIGCIPYPYGEL